MNEKTSVQNMKAVIQETGLTPATLRAWERRYGLFKPQRSSGGHRLYSEDEISLLKWLVEKRKEGLSISRAVDLWRSQSVRSDGSVQESPVIQLLPEYGEGMLSQLCQNWYEACLRFNESEAELAMAKALAIATPEVVCNQVLQKGLAEIGRGWYAGRVSVQQEHFASALAARRLNALFAVAPVPMRSGRLLVACPSGEYHDLALLMLAFILRWQGWEVIYLGADIPVDQLDSTLRTTMPDLVISAAQTLPSAASLIELAEFVNSRSIPLAFGGGIFNEIDDLFKRIPGHFLGRDVNTAPQRIEHLLTYRPSPATSRPLPPVYATALVAFREQEALIRTRVRQIMQSSPVSRRDVERANMNFSSAIIAALTLGEIHFLDYSVGWLNGLLENIGVSPAFVIQYYRVFHRVLKDSLGLQAEPILDWLSRFETLS
ncbi:MAG: MerR family transcriptional regulator [Anaerolineaceae bacterium]